MIPFSTINNKLVLVNRSSFNFFKTTCHANPGKVRKGVGSSSYLSRHVFQKLSNTSANNNVSLRTHKL